MAMTHCFYSPSKARIIDGYVEHAAIGVYGGQTFDEMVGEYPDLAIVEITEAGRMIDDRHREPLSKTTRETYWNMLEILPPENWQQFGLLHGKHFEFFQMSEYDCGEITRYFVQHGDNYYTFADTAWGVESAIIYDWVIAFEAAQQTTIN
jgi:hypothetical protein